jgi:glycogen debranching enzyme
LLESSIHPLVARKLEEATEVIGRCEQRSGFFASAQARRDFWLRDLVFSEEALLGLGYEAVVRRQLDETLKRQKQTGEIPAVIPHNWRSRWLQFSTADSDILFVVGMKKYAEATGDPDVFDANAPALEACLCAIESRQDSHGFVSGMDWRGGMFYNSRRFALSNQVMLVRMFKLLRMREEAEDLRSNIRKVFFSPARGYYADTVWWQLGEVKKDYTFDSFGNALAILEDVSTKSARRVASHFKPGRTQFGQRNIWPPHRSSVARAMATIRGVEALATDRAFLANTPNSYQNASIWPFVELAVIRSLLKLGLVDDANGLLEMMLNRKGVSEWYDPWTGEPRGTPDQLMSAAAIVDACKTLGLD